MPLFSWLHKPLTTRPRARRTSQFRPYLETLEDRTVPSTLTVTNNLDSGAGSLRAEIAAAQPGDTINFAPSLNGQTITLTSGELVLNKSLTIEGPGAGQLAISGGVIWAHGRPIGGSRVFEVIGSGTNVTLSGLTITDGNAARSGFNGDGGAILNYDGSTLTVSGCTVSNSAANDGGGIYNFGATLKLVNSTLTGNLANGTNGDGADGEGGGLYANAMGGTVSMKDCILSGNTASLQGGAVWFRGPTMTVNGCTFSGNVADEAAGLYYVPPVGNDIYNADQGPLLTVSHSIFTNNTPYRFLPIEGPWTNGGGNTGV
jgi:hypothetical protein